MGENQAAHPDNGCPEKYGTYVKQIHPNMAAILNNHGVPFSIQAMIAAAGYISVGDYSSLFEGPADALAKLED